MSISENVFEQHTVVHTVKNDFLSKNVSNLKVRNTLDLEIKELTSKLRSMNKQGNYVHIIIKVL